MPHSSDRQIVTTTTGELFLPTRISYRILDEDQVRRRFHELRCLNPEPSLGRWTWNYEHEAKRLGFSQAYEAIPPERQPVVLATCYVVNPMKQHESGKPVRPFEVVQELLRGGGNAPGTGS